ncbi:MAG: RNA-directed DNA polymerase [Brevinema sp.]
MYIKGSLNQYLPNNQHYSSKNKIKKSIKKLKIDTDKFAEIVFAKNQYNWSEYKLKDDSKDFLIQYKGYYNTRITTSFQLEDYFIYFLTTYLLIDDISKQHTYHTYLMNTWDETKYKYKMYSQEEQELLNNNTDDEQEYTNNIFFNNVQQYVKKYPFLQDIASFHGNFFEINRDGSIISIDIANFYDTIPLSKLKTMLQDTSKKSDIIHVLIRFLNSFDKLLGENRQVGLPQDILGVSGILAHFYMYKLDRLFSKRLQEIEGKYFRFADELVFAIPDKNSESMLLSEISRDLARYNLNVNTSKTVRMYSMEDVENYFLFSYFSRLNDNEQLGNTIQSRPEEINDIFTKIYDIYINKGNVKKDSVIKRFVYILKKYPLCWQVFEDQETLFNLFESDDNLILKLNQFYMNSLYELKLKNDKEGFLELLKSVQHKYPIYTAYQLQLDYALYEIL